MDNRVFKDKQIVEVSTGDGLILIEGTNSLPQFASAVKGNDWLIFWGENDANLLLLLSVEDIDTYAEDMALAIEQDSELPEPVRKIYASLYRNYFSSNMVNKISKMTKTLTYIRVYFNKMDEYC